MAAEQYSDRLTPRGFRLGWAYKAQKRLELYLWYSTTVSRILKCDEAGPGFRHLLDLLSDYDMREVPDLKYFLAQVRNIPGNALSVDTLTRVYLGDRS